MRLKKITLITLTVWLFSSVGQVMPQDKPPAEHFVILENGLAVFVKQRDNLPMVNMVFAIDVGAKNETVKTNGMIHMLEHLLLLGATKSYTIDQVNQEMRQHGAHFNAHTSHDAMTFEISLPAQYWEFGLEILKEKLFQLRLSQDHLDKEKSIIFKELDQQQDDPFTMGTYLVLQYLFEGHPYGLPITGDRKVIEKATREQLESFYHGYFTPANCSLAVVGDIDIVKVSEKIKEMFGTLTNPETPPTLPTFSEPAPLKKNTKIEKKMDIQQAHLVLAFYAPSSNHDDQLAMDFLNQIFGKGLNPLIGQMLVKRGQRMATSISTRYYPFKYGGAFIIHLTMEPKLLSSARMNLLKFMNIAWKFNYSRNDYPLGEQTYITDYIEMARNNIKFSHQQFQELGLNAAVTYARYLLFTRGKEIETTPYMERVAKINSSTLRNVASTYFSGKRYVMITLLPGKKIKDKQDK